MLLTVDFRLEHLRTLVAVVDQGTLEAAARALDITPSAVSQRIKSLETDVGRVLLRRTRPATTTESGNVVLRLARQVLLLGSDAQTSLSASQEPAARISLVVNADSLATWMLPALAEHSAAHGSLFEIHREDEAHSLELLRNGTAMAAVTSIAAPVQGCNSSRLGSMRYRPMARPEFVQKWFANGVSAETLALAPVVDFDRKDRLQDRYLETMGPQRIDPPRHYVPSSLEFAEAIRLGLGWGMVPTVAGTLSHDHGLAPLHGDAAIDVPLYWQAWNLHSPTLLSLTATVANTASRLLDQE